MIETSLSAFQRAHLTSAMEQANLRGAWLGIDLVALSENLRAIKSLLAPTTRIMAVVKADAYGHGAAMVAEAALHHGASSLGVATVEEGAKLRRSGHKSPILVLGIVPDAAYEAAIRHELQLTVSSGRQVQVIERVARGLGRKVDVHLKVNTGMTRVGCELHEAGGLAQYLLHSADLHLAGLSSHLSSADAPQPHDTDRQLGKFQELANRIRAHAHGITCHVANSAGTLFYPNAHFDMVRVGLAMYGHLPASADHSPVSLAPVMSVRARISQVKDVHAGARVGYDLTWIAPSATRLALIPVGYADGLPRALSNRGLALVRGQVCPMVGRISMDQTVLDVGALTVEPGEEVTLMGGQGATALSVDTWAEATGSINYEVLCGLGQRLPRVYYR
ncbi:MAG: alanine racemase [Candidatus Sericytochromatia bacterium]|nr:alanine racemase [Candidatus Sericytochromatia bacterium]